MASFARRAMSLAQIPSARVPASVCQRRGLAGAADHHGSTKVDFWKQPTNPGNWKEEHFVLISLSGWGLLFYSGYKLFTGGKGDDEVIAFSSSFTKQTKQSGSLFLYSLQNFDSSFAEACAMNLSLGKDKESSPSRAGLVSNKASKITSLTVFVCFLLK
ncbi:unnamed protein product [Brassica oleracea var. botrytis]|uniref:Uncharacterized protein n=1 Tax=Brassica oleracea TaxID=3712 RepID=A0A3P6EQV5_BRAOL|nr:unnamed protein product [Brassica oleracea]